MQQCGCIVKQHRINILIREIDDRMEVGDHTDQFLAHVVYRRADRTHHLRRRVLRGFGCAGGDQIVYRFRFGQPQFTVEERPAGKLARLGLPHTLCKKRIHTLL